MTTITIDLSDIDSPIPGAWQPTPGLTMDVQCGNVMCDAVTGEGEFRCENRVWIDPEWIVVEEMWPVRRQLVLCPDCFS